MDFLQNAVSEYADSHFDLFLAQRGSLGISFIEYLRREYREGHLRAETYDYFQTYHPYIHDHYCGTDFPPTGLNQKQMDKLFDVFAPDFIKKVAESSIELVNQRIRECQERINFDTTSLLETDHNTGDFQEYSDFRLVEGLDSFNSNVEEFKSLFYVKDEIIDVVLGRVTL